MPKNYNLFLKGGVGDWDFNTDMVNYVLDKHKDSEVSVLVCSLGGYTNEAVAISSLFKLHGNVHVHFVGHNASAATIAAMGAKHVSIDEDGAFLVHKCLYPIMEWAYMNADELDEHIKKLESIKKDNETIDSCVAGMYARRCKKPKDDLLALMKVGGWLTPEEALEWGFVDEITHNADDEKPQLTAAAISSLNAAGIPLPPNIKRKKGSVLDRFLAFLQSPFANQAADENAKPTNFSSQMPDLSPINSILGESIALADDKLTLSAQQVEKLLAAVNADKTAIADKVKAIADKDAEINTLKASVEEKDRTIADLRKEPAAPTSQVVDTDKTDDPYKPVSDAEAIAASKAFLDSSF